MNRQVAGSGWNSIWIEDVDGAARVTLLRPGCTRDVQEVVEDASDIYKSEVHFGGEVLDLLNRLVEIVEEEKP